MYAPAPFYSASLTDTEQLVNHIVMGTLLLSQQGKMSGSPLPFRAIRTDRGLRLFGHMDRQNPLSQQLRSASDILVVFWGPNAYVSPSFYTQGPRVPTWLFASCHIHGSLTVIDEEAVLASQMDALTRHVEPQDSCWQIEQVSAYKHLLLPAIVGFWIDVEEAHCQFRHGQHNSPSDQASVRQALQAGQPGDQAMANWITTWQS
ncbi:MAG: FMN-binding negative transcriptional regulator [Gammaproteobacteria bacterium]|nr:FMN-binding negative transcriptional regulator [Gammaproteobacteria bacterium]